MFDDIVIKKQSLTSSVQLWQGTLSVHSSECTLSAIHLNIDIIVMIINKITF